MSTKTHDHAEFGNHGKTITREHDKARRIMHEFKAGTLHSGKGGPVVKERSQAKAILMSYKRKGMA